MPVVEAHAKRPCEEPLDERAKDKLVRGGKGGYRASILRENVLPEAYDSDPPLETLEQVAHLERLAHVVVLVHVERLEMLAAREDDRVVLVLGLALTDYGVARQLHLEHDAIPLRLGVPAKQHRELLTRLFGVDVCDAQVVGILLAKLINGSGLPLVLRFCALLEVSVLLACYDELELRCHNHLNVLLGHPLKPRQQPQRISVEHYPAHCSAEHL
eukprot:4379086-Prymnesium_polylepis.1